MTDDALETFIAGAQAAFGPLSTETVARCHGLLEALTRAPTDQPWLEALLRAPPAGAELYRDPAQGFLLLTHAEAQGRYRAPHDHGDGWVIYGVQHGEVEMRTYGEVVEPDGRVRLVRRDAYRMGPGECRAYLPGDIHDTRCLSPDVLMFRFTSCDLAAEDRAGRMTRYVREAGLWTRRAA